MTSREPAIRTSADVVALICATENCERWQTAQARHLENLLAASPWRCADHNERTAP